MITAWKRAAVALALVPAFAMAGSPALADPPVCTAPVPSSTQPGYTVADPDCDISGTPFVPLAGARTYTGISAGAAYRIEVPAKWNGRLVVYAHGYRGTGTTVYVDSPGLRAHYHVGALGERYFEEHAGDMHEVEMLEQKLAALDDAELDRAATACAMTSAALWLALDGVLAA